MTSAEAPKGTMTDPAKSSELSPSAEDALTALAQEHGWVEIAYVAKACDIDVEACGVVLGDLVARGLVSIQQTEHFEFLTPPAPAVAATQSGALVAQGLFVVTREGPVAQYVAGLSDLSRAILDATMEPQLRIGGAWTKRSQVRAVVRKRLPAVDIPTATDAIEALLASGHLQVAGGSTEPQYQVTLRGLLASAWGTNGLHVVDQVLDLLRSAHDSDPGVSRFSWRWLRRHAHLPYKAFHLAYIAIVSSNLGHGVFRDGDDLWWAIRSELDVLLEHKTGLDYLETCLRPAAVVPVPAPAALAPAREPVAAAATNVQPLGERTEMRPLVRPKYTVFVSSTQRDLGQERQDVIGEILKAGHIPCGMEQFSASADRGWTIITDTIDICDYYVLIIAGLYGSVDDETGMSWTEREYEYAVSKGLPVLAFIRDDHEIAKVNTEDDAKKRTQLKEFVTRVEAKWLREKWTTSEDLCRRVALALMKQIDRDEAGRSRRPGWYRGDNIPAPPGVAEQIARLSRENQELRDRVVETPPAARPALTIDLLPPSTGNTRPGPDAMRYRHTRVSNLNRGAPVHNVQVYLTSVAERPAEGPERVLWNGPEVRMFWQWERQEGRGSRTIGAPLLCDLLSVSRSKDSVRIEVIEPPWNLDPELPSGKTYVLTFVARSDEDDSPPFQVEVRWDGKWGDDQDETAFFAEHCHVKPVVPPTA